MARYRLTIDFDDRTTEDDDSTLYTELAVSLAVHELRKCEGIDIETVELIDRLHVPEGDPRTDEVTTDEALTEQYERYLRSVTT